jgi:hypothetical protein
VQRTLIILGLVIVAAGLAWPWISKLGLVKLPIVTCLVISVVLSLILWFLRR